MSQRIKRVNELIKHTVSKLLLKEADFDKDILITVTHVKTAPDLSKSTVFVSVIPEKKADYVIDVLKKIIYHIQQKNNKKLVMKRVPKIEFRKETKTASADRIEKLLDELKKEEKKDNIQ